MSILLVIIVLSFLVVIHEIGHLLVSLWAKVGVEEFGLGYPPRAAHLFSWRGIPFTLNWIPFGGFVRLKGEDAEVGSIAQEGEYRYASRAKRMAIIVAGVVINFLFGVLVFSILFTITGIPTPLTRGRIVQLQEGTPAQRAQLPTDVEILAISSAAGRQETPTRVDVMRVIGSNRGESITVYTTGVCDGLRCGETEQATTVYVRTEAETPSGEGAMGIIFQEEILVQYPMWQMPFRGAAYGMIKAVQLGQTIVLSLGSLVHQLVTTGAVPTDMVGPIGIASQAQEVKLANQGLLASVIFAAMISINLAIMNILPIAPLDGGRLLFLLLEPIVRKKWLERIEHWANYLGFVVLIGLIILISIRDIWNIFT